MNPIPLEIEITGVDKAEATLNAITNALRNRGPLHALIAAESTEFTRKYLRSDTSHKSAQRLGAPPSGFRAKNAKSLQPDSDEDAAIIRIPRSTGLGRAFGDITIRPGSGRTYLTIPGCAETYGHVVADFPMGSFSFTVIGGRYPALVWNKAGGSHQEWSLAYWLKREVFQKQERTLLPSDDAYLTIGREISVQYINAISQKSA